jgi:hypothetical protein
VSSLSALPRVSSIILGTRAGRQLRSFLARPFSGNRTNRLLIAYEARRITEAQIFPFAAYEAEIADAHDVEIRYIENSKILDGVPDRLRDATHVVFQSWLTDPADRLRALMTALARDLPDTRKTYIDGFANSDLRFARDLVDIVDAYGKKSLFRDRRQFLRPTYGHTNLVEFYSRHYGLVDEMVDWEVPEDIIGRLHLTPNFFTGSQFLDAFRKGAVPEAGGRPIDIHARLATKGSAWYTRMRSDFIERLEALSGPRTVTGSAVQWSRYMAEMGQSKICASPFGYGELCWRDIEAFLAGAVLLKPNMSHLDTLPDLYRPWETYAPIAWDFSDLPEVVDRLLSDEALRTRLAQTAFTETRRYLAEDRFVTDMRFIFQ